MRSTYSGQASRRDLAALGYELSQQTHIFVIDRFDLFNAELANFLASEEFAATFARTARASSGTRTTRTAAIATTTLRSVAVARSSRWCFCFFCHNAPAFSIRSCGSGALPRAVGGRGNAKTAPVPKPKL